MKRKVFLGVAPFLFVALTVLGSFELSHGQGVEKLNTGYSGTKFEDFVDLRALRELEREGGLR